MDQDLQGDSTEANHYAAWAALGRRHRERSLQAIPSTSTDKLPTDKLAGRMAHRRLERWSVRSPMGPVQQRYGTEPSFSTQHSPATFVCLPVTVNLCTIRSMVRGLIPRALGLATAYTM